MRTPVVVKSSLTDGFVPISTSVTDIARREVSSATSSRNRCATVRPSDATAPPVSLPWHGQ